MRTRQDGTKPFPGSRAPARPAGEAGDSAKQRAAAEDRRPGPRVLEPVVPARDAGGWPGPGTPAGLVRLQRLVGNRAVATAMTSAQQAGPRTETGTGAGAGRTVQRDEGAAVGPSAPAGAKQPSASMPQPAENTSTEPLHVLTYQGTRYAIPESQWPGFVTGLKRIFRTEVMRPIESRMGLARGLYDSMNDLNNDQKAVAWVLEAVRTGINLDEVAPLVVDGEAALRKLQNAAAGDDLAAIEAAARTAQEKAQAAHQAIEEYRSLQIGAGEITVTALEVTQTVCFTIFVIAGGAVLAAPVAAGGLGLGAVSSGALLGGGTALLTSAAGVGAKVVYGDEAGWADLKNVAIDSAVGAASGAVGAGVAAKLTPYLAPALTRSLVASGMFKGVTEKVLSHEVHAVVSGSAGGMVQGAISDGVKVLQGKATFEQLLRNVVTNLIVGGITGLVGRRLTTGRAVGAGPVETTPQTRNVRVANPELVARYEQVANAKMPQIVNDVVANEAVSTPGRARLTKLGTDFDALRAEVGDARQLTADQRTRANGILREARDLSGKDYKGLQGKVTKQLRADPELKAIADQLIAAGDAQAKQTGALRIKVIRADTGAESFEPLNLEHRTRQSDNPWMAKNPGNLIVTDAPQNQQYLEAIREQGGVWPTSAVEEFVVRHQLNDQGIDFTPGPR
jgi:hypothetical protein